MFLPQKVTDIRKKRRNSHVLKTPTFNLNQHRISFRTHFLSISNSSSNPAFPNHSSRMRTRGTPSPGDKWRLGWMRNRAQSIMAGKMWRMFLAALDFSFSCCVCVVFWIFCRELDLCMYRVYDIVRGVLLIFDKDVWWVFLQKRKFSVGMNFKKNNGYLIMTFSNKWVNGFLVKSFGIKQRAKNVCG